MTSRSRRASEVRRQSTSRGPSPTPPASGSRRQSTGTPTRLSLGSSSGRRSNRHSGSLQEVSELLTRTRESLLRASLATTETMSQYEEHTPSRQLSFGSARRDDEGKEEEGEDVTSFAALLEEQDRLRETESRSHTDNEDADYGGDTVEEEEEEEEEEENDAEADAGKGTTRRSRPGRLRWTKKEEEALTKGVEAFGVGKWRKILASGMGIFNSRRTNVDLKDKWRGLSKRIDQQRASGDRTPPRPRRRSSIQSPSPAPKRQRQGERSAAAMAKSAMLAVRTHEESQTDYSAELSTQPTQQSDSVVDDSQDPADGQSAVPPTEDEEEDAEEETVELKIGTDDTFPSLLDVTVTTAVGATVSVLKRELANQLLEKTAKPSTVQLVAIRTRRLLGDSERVDACLESDGTIQAAPFTRSDSSTMTLRELLQRGKDDRGDDRPLDSRFLRAWLGISHHDSPRWRRDIGYRYACETLVHVSITFSPDCACVSSPERSDRWLARLLSRLTRGRPRGCTGQ